MQTLRVIVARRRESVPGDVFEVYSNGGGGAIDYVNPVTSRPVPFWPDAEPMAGHLADAHLCGRHLAAVTRGEGHLEGAHLLDGHLAPSRAMVVDVGAFCFGRYRFAVRASDAAGNVAEMFAAEQEVVVNSSPEPPGRLMPECEDDDGRMVLSFQGSLQVV